MPEPDYETASRIAYDQSAARFAASVGTHLSDRFEAPLDRAVLAPYVEMIASRPPGPVLDVGCGPGRVAAFVAAHGLEVHGIDIAPEMIEEARRAHPTLRFDVGTLTDLPVADGSVAGALYWYSIITTPPAALGDVWRELDRVLRPGGGVLLAFQLGHNDAEERHGAYGSTADLTLYRHDVDEVASSLDAAGFDIRAEVRREPELEHETTPQGMLFATR